MTEDRISRSFEWHPPHGVRHLTVHCSLLSLSRNAESFGRELGLISSQGSSLIYAAIGSVSVALNGVPLCLDQYFVWALLGAPCLAYCLERII